MVQKQSSTNLFRLLGYFELGNEVRLVLDEYKAVVLRIQDFRFAIFDFNWQSAFGNQKSLKLWTTRAADLRFSICDFRFQLAIGIRQSELIIRSF